MKKILLVSTLLLTHITQTLLGSTTLTLYEKDHALVQEHYTFTLSPKEQVILFNNLPTSLIQDSLFVDLPSDVTLVMQEYRPKVKELYSLAKNYCNKDIELRSGATVTLLSVTQKHALIKNRENYIATVALSDLLIPFNVQHFTKSNQLRCSVATKQAMQAPIVLRYLTDGIDYHIHYALELTHAKLSLHAFATLTNKTDKDFFATQLTLVAGEPYKKRDFIPLLRSAAPHTKSAIQPQAQQNYYSYKIPYLLNLLNGQSVTIPLFYKEDLPFTEHYSVQLNNPLYLMGERSRAVKRSLTIAPLNTILPKGNVRIYAKEKGSDDALFLGQDTIQNLPKQTPLTIHIGEDFDTKVTQRVVKRNDSAKNFDVTLAYTLTNHSDKPRHITLHIPFVKKAASKIVTKTPYIHNPTAVIIERDLAPQSKQTITIEFITPRR